MKPGRPLHVLVLHTADERASLLAQRLSDSVPAASLHVATALSSDVQPRPEVLANRVDVAVIVLDVRAGWQVWAGHHATRLALLGATRLVLAVDQMEQVEWQAARFNEVASAWHQATHTLGLVQAAAVPLSSAENDHIGQVSARMPWFGGPGLAAQILAPAAEAGGTTKPDKPMPTDADLADQFECSILWLDQAPLFPGRALTMHLGELAVAAEVTQIKHQIDIRNGAHIAARTLAQHAIGVCTLALQQPIAFDQGSRGPGVGRFSLVDPALGSHRGNGLLHFALRRSQNLRLQGYDVDRAARAAVLGQQPAVVWLTGLSGAGKSTLANVLARRLHAERRAACVLDGDNLRHGLNRDLGFTPADRVENIRRVSEVARLMADAGLIVITALISPFLSDRLMARGRMQGIIFIEVHVATPLAVAEQRDAKGLYAKARRGELPNFTGIDSPYEPPDAPNLRLDLSTLDAETAGAQVLALLRQHGALQPP